MKNYDEVIDIRTIQHFLYCPHRYGLIEIDCAWVENGFVTRGNLVHENVNLGYKSSSRDEIVERSVEVYNDEWNIFGVIDCLILKKDNNGVFVDKYNDKFSFIIVEYKPTAPKNIECRMEDKMQILAQKICIDSIFKCNAQTAIYYADTKHRVMLTFSMEEYSFLKTTLEDIKKCKQSNKIPKVLSKQHCSGCSFYDICFPKSIMGDK